jgi:predicted DNA-binding WGR domain protein
MPLTAAERTKIRYIKQSRVKPSFRTFINIENGHNKFWKIGRINYNVYTQYGAIDTDGVSSVRQFDSQWQASAYELDKIREKLTKGYEEI